MERVIEMDTKTPKEDLPRLALGEVFEIAVCIHCGRSIQHVFWGNGGTIWEHTETKREECERPKYAQPELSSLVRRVPPCDHRTT